MVLLIREQWFVWLINNSFPNMFVMNTTIRSLPYHLTRSNQHEHPFGKISYCYLYTFCIGRLCAILLGANNINTWLGKYLLIGTAVDQVKFESKILKSLMRIVFRFTIFHNQGVITILSIAYVDYVASNFINREIFVLI